MLNPKLYKRLQTSRSIVAPLSLILLLAALGILPACSINANDKSADGEKHVDIKSPLGDLHVSDQADIRDAGLSVYPGAKPAPKDSGSDEKSANVNLSLPGFSLKVIAAEFLSDDSPDKLLAYYDKELHKYGKPIQCHGEWTNGAHVNASSDHHDKDDSSKQVSCDSKNGGNSIELKVGTEGNQHVVSVKPNDKGSRFALVYIRMNSGSDSTI